MKIADAEGEATAQPSPSAAPTRPKRNYRRTGLNALKSRVKVKGLQAIDRRTSAARALLQWRAELLEDLGGQEQVSAAQLALVDAAARERLYLDTLDRFLVEQGDLVNRRKRSAHPVLLQRMQLADALQRRLVALGLERRAKRVPSLAEYLQRRGASPPEPTAGAPDAEPRRERRGAPESAPSAADAPQTRQDAPGGSGAPQDNKDYSGGAGGAQDGDVALQSFAQSFAQPAPQSAGPSDNVGAPGDPPRAATWSVSHWNRDADEPGRQGPDGESAAEPRR
jgi:hypothetical protein